MEINEKIMPIMILIFALAFLGSQIYEGTKTNSVLISNIVSDGEYLYVDLSKSPGTCDWDEENQRGFNCVANEDVTCKYNLDYTWAGECWGN